MYALSVPLDWGSAQSASQELLPAKDCNVSVNSLEEVIVFLKLPTASEKLDPFE